MNIYASAHPEFRIMAVLPQALLVTAALLYLMHVLTYVEHPELDQVAHVTIPEVVNIPKTIDIQYKQIKPEPVPEPAVQPIMEPLVYEPETVTPSINGDMTFKPPLGGGDIILIQSTDNVIQQVMVPPQYPISALRRGQEGFVDLAFDVTVIGTTENIRVVAAEPAGVFDSAAIRAVKRWKYQPRNADSASPVGLRERIRFSIDQ